MKSIFFLLFSRCICSNFAVSSIDPGTSFGWNCSSYLIIITWHDCELFIRTAILWLNRQARIRESCVTNIYQLQLLNFTHQWHPKKLPNIFNQHFRYASEVHTYNTRYASKSNFYKPRSRTNIGKQTTAAMATELWQQLPPHIKDLSTYNCPKTLKEYLLAEQLTSWNYFVLIISSCTMMTVLSSFFCHLCAFFFFLWCVS